MAYSTIQKIREKAGIQNRYKEYPANAVSGSSNIWEVDADDYYKIVPNNEDGATVISTNDVLLELNGASIGASAVDQVTGEITLTSGSSTGACLLVTFASSPVSDEAVYDRMNEAFSTVNAFVAKEYDLPLSVSVPLLTELEAKLAAGYILQASYGTSAEDLAEDGYRMQQEAIDMLERIAESKIDLVDGNGNPIAKTDDTSGSLDEVTTSNSRTKGYLFSPDNEEFELVDPDNIVKEGI